MKLAKDYFATIGIPIVAGREFTRNDDENAPPVAIVNETMAAKYWPGKDPVGQRLKVKDKWTEIVGVAKNANYRTKLEQSTPFFYVPVRQNFFVQNNISFGRTRSPAAIRNALAREVHALDPNLAPLDAISLQEQVDLMSYTQRLAVALLAIFGGMALFLAAIGLVRGHVIFGFASDARARHANGARRARTGHSPAGPFTGIALNDRRDRDRWSSGPSAHSFDGQSTLQSQSARSNRLRAGVDHSARGCAARLLSSCAPGHSDRSRPGAESLAPRLGVVGSFLSVRIVLLHNAQASDTRSS